ncbi:unnamed protein product [Lampetra fluviatilis]
MSEYACAERHETGLGGDVHPLVLRAAMDEHQGGGRRAPPADSGASAPSALRVRADAGFLHRRADWPSLRLGS